MPEQALKMEFLLEVICVDHLQKKGGPLKTLRGDSMQDSG